MPGAANSVRYARFVKYTPPDTITTPATRDQVNGSFRIRFAMITALIGTKLINKPARAGPIFWIP